jgi:hypothetical protein
VHTPLTRAEMAQGPTDSKVFSDLTDSSTSTVKTLGWLT